MASPAAASWSHLSVSAREALVRQRVEMALRDAPAPGWLSTWEIIRIAELAEVASGELHAIIGRMVNDGILQGRRGPRGWAAIAATAAPRDPVLPGGGLPEGRAAPPVTDSPRSAPNAPAAPPLGGRTGRNGQTAAATMRPIATGSTPIVPQTTVSSRNPSVLTRLPQRQPRWLAGVLLLLCTLTAAGGASVYLFRGWQAEESGQPTARERWYDQMSTSFVERMMAGQPGYQLPEEFTAITGIRNDAPPPQLVWGVKRYVQASLLFGLPSHIGLLGWARASFGELPSDAAGQTAWFQRAAATYSERHLSGTSGYDLTTTILSDGGLAPGERDPILLQQGIEKALRFTILQPTPHRTGLLYWSEQEFGPLPAK